MKALLCLLNRMFGGSHKWKKVSLTRPRDLDSGPYEPEYNRICSRCGATRLAKQRTKRTTTGVAG